MKKTTQLLFVTALLMISGGAKAQGTETVSNYDIWSFSAGGDDITTVKKIEGANGGALYVRATSGHKCSYSEINRAGLFSDYTEWSCTKMLYVDNEGLNPSTTEAGDETITDATDRCVALKTAVPGTLYVAFYSGLNDSEATDMIKLFFNGEVVRSVNAYKVYNRELECQRTASTSSARCNTFKYHASTGGNFFFGGKSTRVACVKFIPDTYSDPSVTEECVSATSFWNFEQYHAFTLSNTEATAQTVNHAGLYLHKTNSDKHYFSVGYTTLSADYSFGPEGNQVTLPAGQVARLRLMGTSGTPGVSSVGSTVSNIDALAISLSSAGKLYVVADAISNEKTFTFYKNGTAGEAIAATGGMQTLEYEATTYGTVYLKSTGNPYYYAVLFIPNSDENYTMKRTVTLGSAGMATFSAAQNYVVPEGLKAYKVKSTNESSAILSEIGDIIPACTGVVLMGEAGTYTLTSTEEMTTVSDNLLKANIAEYGLQPTNGTKTNYLLYTDGFRPTSGNNKLAAGKAFLSIDTPAGSSAKEFYDLDFLGDVTGISKVDNNTDNASLNDVMYSITGQRVGNGYKGIVIKNGKKYIYK